MTKKQSISVYYIRFFLIGLGIFLPLFFGEIYIRLAYETPIVKFSGGTGYTESTNGGVTILGEKADVDFLRNYDIQVGKESLGHDNEDIIKNKDTLTETYKATIDTSKRNFAFIGDSVTFGWVGGMINNRFTSLLNSELSRKGYRFFNFSQSGQSILGIFMEYEKFVKNYPINTVIYLYTNQDIYYNKMVNGKNYATPVILETTKTREEETISLTGFKKLDTLLNNVFIMKFILGKYTNYKKTFAIKNIQVFNDPEYNTKLVKRFLSVMKILKQETDKKGQRLIVIVSPSVYFKKNPPIPGAYERIYEEDNFISHALRKESIETYNMYDLGIEKKDFFIDDCCHLNKAGNNYYADFIKTLILDPNK